MRIALTIAALLCMSSGVAAAASKCFLAIKGVAVEGEEIFLNAQSNGDMDGDFVADEAVVRLQCAGGVLRAAHFTVTSARDPASGPPGGKRTSQPVAFAKEWAPVTPQLARFRATYDVKQVNEARMKDGRAPWTAIALANVEGLCAAVQNSVATTSGSNVQNN